jgi:argininosuccinate lyase
MTGTDGIDSGTHATSRARSTRASSRARRPADIRTDGGDVVRGERFAGGPARAFLSSLDGGEPAPDARLFAADLDVDRAHVVMLAEQDIIEAADAAAILDALAAVEAEGVGELPEAEDVHAAIETAVVERVGDAGRRMHTARSRNDEVATCIRHRLRADLLGATEAAVDCREALLDCAAAHVETVLPGYTHRQPAQPTTVAHWCLSYAGALGRDIDRLLAAYDRTNRSPLGAAAFAGTPFDVDRERTAALLGFDGLVHNAADAVASRDFALEALGACATLGTTLAGCCTDGIEFASDGLLTLDDDYASTSSVMPQKKNPDTLELARARAGDAAAAEEGVRSIVSGLPRAYNRDLQRATPHVWRGVDAVTDAASVVAGAIATATWDEDACLAAADDGFSTATGVADAFAAAGVPFRTAHAIVADAAERLATGEADDGAASADTEGDAATRREALDAAAEEALGGPLSDHVDPAAIERALNPATNVAERDSTGGPAPVAVTAALEEARESLAADRADIAARREALGAAAETLDTEVARHA